jgi:hypothetical protein
MRIHQLLILFLLLTPVLACFKIDPPDDEHQGLLALSFSLETTLVDDTAYLKGVEFIFDNYINITSLGTGFCADEITAEDGDHKLCKRVAWKYNDLAISDEDELFYTILADICLEEGSTLNTEIIVDGKCPVYVYEKRVYSDAFASTHTSGPVCGDLHQVEATLVNVSILSYYRPFGGNATLYISGAGKDELITQFNEYCTPNDCGQYSWITNETKMSFGFRACANATHSELMVGQGQESIRAWWKFSYVNKTIERLSHPIKILGKPRIMTIQTIPDTVLEQQNMIFKAGVKATCGDLEDYEVGLDPTNTTCFYSQIEKVGPTTRNVTHNKTCESVTVTSPNVTLNLKNLEVEWADFSIYTRIKSEVNFAIYGTYENYTAFDNSTNVSVLYNPHRCNDGFQWCGSSCKVLPNCTRPCSLGFVCDDRSFNCVFRKCGTPCPNYPEKTCDAQGYCLPPQLQGYPCDCVEMCLRSYIETDVCLHSVSCDDACRYETQQCLGEGVCTAYGCCGDGICDKGENCEACPGDCTCNDDNPCTLDTCSNTRCLNENYPCGVACPNGMCNGFGVCSADACCSDEDCLRYECRKGTCQDNMCTFDQRFTCKECMDGWCSEGECVPFLEFEDECNCEYSCGSYLVCSGGRCSLCGNKECNEGECYSCIFDCDIGYCAEEMWYEHGVKLIIAPVLIIFVVWYSKKMLPSVITAMRKAKPPPDQY